MGYIRKHGYNSVGQFQAAGCDQSFCIMQISTNRSASENHADIFCARATPVQSKRSYA